MTTVTLIYFCGPVRFTPCRLGASDSRFLLVAWVQLGLKMAWVFFGSLGSGIPETLIFHLF